MGESAPPQPSNAAKYVAEFVGTYMLIMTVGCNVLTGTAPTWAVTSIACTLMVMIYALANISGAKFNPAVSFAVAVAGKQPMGDAVIEMIVQTLAGVAAGVSYGLAMWKVFDGGPVAGHTWLQAGLVELLYTFMLCFVVLNVAASKDAPNQYFGLAIGFVVIAGGYGGGAVSGGCFNPAVAFGIDLSSLGLGLNLWSLGYAAFELVGAALAGVLFNVVRAHEENEDGKPSTTAKLLSEFLGTYFLVLTVGLNVLGGSKAPVWSIAASLMCMIFALGGVSGANFNPAVSICLTMTGRDQVLTRNDGDMYIIVQIVGGIMAGLTYSVIHGGKSFGLAPGAGYDHTSACFAEVTFTFLLCYVVCCVATVGDKPLTQFFGLAIGSCVTAGGYAIGAVSGGSLNPAVSFGISVAHLQNGGGLINCLWYCTYEIIGAVLAAYVFKFTHASDSSFVKEA